MTRHFNPAKGYKLFDELSRQINAWTSGNSPSVLGYGQRDIARRLSQRIADLGLNPFLRETSRRYEAGLEPLPGGRATLHCGGLRITTHDGRVVPGIGLFIRSTAGFLAHWWRVLFSFICAMFRRQKWPMLPVTGVLRVTM